MHIAPIYDYYNINYSIWFLVICEFSLINMTYNTHLFEDSTKSSRSLKKTTIRKPRKFWPFLSVGCFKKRTQLHWVPHIKTFFSSIGKNLSSNSLFLRDYVEHQKIIPFVIWNLSQIMNSFSQSWQKVNAIFPEQNKRCHPEAV